MKVLITDPSYKHAIALSRYLRQYDPSIERIGVFSYQPKFPFLFRDHYDRLIVGDLKDVIQKEPHDLLIPVGNHSVEIASACLCRTAALPSPESLQIGLSKTKTLALAEKLEIPIPRTHRFTDQDNLEGLDLSFPCVVKGALEAGKNVVSYPKNKQELKQALHWAIQDPSQKREPPLVQEYVPGVGLGFFGFYQKGVLKRFYMHQRIREFPVTGGASTAAKTVFHPAAFEYGKRLLDHLEWNGPAMVEFKYDPVQERLALMEINPKFWGSTELGLAAGVNFGELLVRTQRGEDLIPELSPDAYRRCAFYWPFEGDFAALWQTGNWKGWREYFSPFSKTNVKENGYWLNCYRLLDTWRKK